MAKSGRFWIWVEYKNSSWDLDCWLHSVARKLSNGGGTMLSDDLRDLSFDAGTRASAIALARRVTGVLKQTRSEGSWQVCVKDMNAEDNVHLWSAGEISKPRIRQRIMRKHKKQRAR